MILMTQGGWGVQNLGKPDDVILERSLRLGTYDFVTVCLAIEHDAPTIKYPL